MQILTTTALAPILHEESLATVPIQQQILKTQMAPTYLAIQKIAAHMPEQVVDIQQMKMAEGVPLVMMVLMMMKMIMQVIIIYCVCFEVAI